MSWSFTTDRWLIPACGAAQFLLLAGLSRVDARETALPLLWLMGGAAVAYCTVLVRVARRPPRSSRQLAGCVALSIAWRVALVGGAPLASDDVYRYVWDGRVQQHGRNPYAAVPADPDLAALHTGLTRRIDPASAALPAIYPPAAQWFLRAVTTVHESVTALVAAVVVCDLLTMLVLWRWLVATGRSPWWVLAWAWHPLVALEGAGGGHIDLVGTLFVVTAAYALHARRTLIAAVALAVAFCVKLLPLVLAPLLWRRVRLRDALAAAGVAAAFYLSFMDGASPLGSLAVYATQWRFNGPLFAWVEQALGAAGAVAVTIAGGCAVAVLARARLPRAAPEAWAWPLAATLLLMPVVYPWYLVWLIPFLVSPRTWPLIPWSLGVVLTYVVWDARARGAGWVLPGWVEPVEYVLLAGGGLAVWLAARRERQPGAARSAALPPAQAADSPAREKP